MQLYTSVVQYCHTTLRMDIMCPAVKLLNNIQMLIDSGFYSEGEGVDVTLHNVLLVN